MRLLGLLLLAFILIPLAELSLLLLLGSHTRWWVPLLLVIVTGVCGAWLARHQGWRTCRRIQQELLAGRMPTDSLLDAVLILVAGILLLTPGMLTDVCGISLLLPPCRRLVKYALLRWIRARFRVQALYGAGPEHPPGRDEIIDSYVVDARRDNGPRRPPDP